MTSLFVFTIGLTLAILLPKIRLLNMIGNKKPELPKQYSYRFGGDSLTFVNMLDRFPNEIEDKFHLNKSDVIYEHHWLNRFYGSSILKSIVAYEEVSNQDGIKERVEIPNSLRKEISDEYSNNPKYYVIQNVYID